MWFNTTTLLVVATASGNTIVYNAINYVNTNSGVNKVVNLNTMSTVYDESNDTTYTIYDWHGSWIADEYRILKFDESVVKLETLNFLQALNSGSLSGTTSGNVGVTNAFTLLGNAFGSVSTLFGLAILPGITLGTLFFLPLVVAIVVILIKVLKK